jgi:cytochrome P450
MRYSYNNLFKVLRHSPPAHVIVRFANCPMAIDKNEIKKGDGVILHLE